MASIDCTKRVNIAKGSGVTVKYIIEKGSAPVEAFREVSHQFARTFGFTYRARRHKEVDVGQDLCLLTETMMEAQLYATGQRNCRLVDLGAQILNSGKFREFIRTTTWDPAAGYPVAAPEVSPDEDDPLLNGSVFDRVDSNPLARDGFDHMDDGDSHAQRYPGLGSLGGGMDYPDVHLVWEGNNEEEVSTWDTSVDKRDTDARGGGLGLSGNAWAGYDGADTGGGGCGAGMWKGSVCGPELARVAMVRRGTVTEDAKKSASVEMRNSSGFPITPPPLPHTCNMLLYGVATIMIMLATNERHGTRAVSALFVAQMVLGPGWKQEHPGVAIGAEYVGSFARREARLEPSKKTL
ncbi:hypothetical protein B0H14DRAFT_2575337 [Mycena olivaceomarginata]|nr:hypothetical protein B0H14DRAFT_2575337 [Mycena olivaceomarginata]